jgi:CubicO group peptidase (beta-lactamase class C family)
MLRLATSLVAGAHLRACFCLAITAVGLIPAGGLVPAAAQAPASASPRAPAETLKALRPGQRPVARDVAGDAHVYGLVLARNQLVRGVADQQTVDVVVRVTDPAGRAVGTWDASERGPDPFQFTARRAGRYRVEVVPFERASGRYAIALERVEPLAATPAGQVEQLMRAYDRPDAPGAVVAVVRAGRPVFVKAYGMANLEYGAPNTAGTVFHVASLSKQFTAFAVARLAADGRLALDADVRTYLPEFPDVGAPITLRHLVHHTSGLRDQWGLWAMAGGRLDDVITQENLLDLVRRQRALDFVPGREHRYSNTNYLLLAEVVARVSGRPFGEWMRTTVFAPLGMTRTHVHDDHERIVPDRAYSYQASPTGGTYRHAVLTFANAGATGLFTTAEDLARWLANFGTGRVGGPAVLRQMQERGVLASGDTLGYAYGLVVDDHHGLRRLHHGGEDAGYRAELAYYPALDAGVVVLSNSALFDAGATARAVAEAFFGDRMRPQPETPLAPAPPSAVAAPSTPPAAPWRPAAADLSQYVGRYYSPELETTYAVALEGSRLVARHRRHGAIPLTPLERDAFRGGAWYFSRVRFERGAGGRVGGLLVSGGRVRDLRFDRQE